MELQRELVCVTDPVRYCSHAVRAFIREMFGITLETSAIGCFLPPPKEVCCLHACAPRPLPDAMEELRAPCTSLFTERNFAHCVLSHREVERAAHGTQSCGGGRRTLRTCRPSAGVRTAPNSAVSCLFHRVEQPASSASNGADAALRQSALQGRHTSTVNGCAPAGEVQGRQPVEVDPGMLPLLEKLPFTLQQAINFRMCARCGAVKQAALALGVSPGAVSRSIALLEQVPYT